MGFQPSGVKEFIKLDDTPSAFTGEGTKSVKVNAGETALEFQAESGITGVTVRKNSQMPVLGVRPQLNFIEGAAVDLKLEDNPPDDEIDIAISAKYPTRFMTLIPDDAILPVANPPDLASVDGANFSYACLDFDQATEEKAYWGWFLTPDYLEENIVVDIYWIATPAVGDVKFGFSVLGRQKGETWDSALGTERTVIQTTGGAGVLNRARITTFSPNWAAGDVVQFKLARKAADGTDTLADDARVLKVVVSYTGQFPQSFYPLAEPVEITGIAIASWQDIDISAYAPAGATGAILHFENTWSLGELDYGFRKKGSTDNLLGEIYRTSHNWVMIGVDESRKCQVYIETAQIKVYLVGYTATGVVFFDNGYDKTPAKGSFQDVDCSVEAPDAIGLIFEFHATGHAANGRPSGLRKNGSADDFSNGCQWTQHFVGIIGCDASQIAEAWIPPDEGGSIYSLYLIGYVTEGAVFKTTSPNKSISPDVWTDIDCSVEAPSAIMLFIEAHCNQTTWTGQWALRKHGTTESIYRSVYAHFWAFVACDSGQIIDGKVNTENWGFVQVELHLVGYATWGGA